MVSTYVQRAGAALVAAGLLIGLTACSTSSTGATGTPTPSDSSSPASTTPSTDPSSTPASSAPAPSVPGLPKQPVVTRPGGLPSDQRASAKPTPFASPATFSDGITVTVTKIRHWTVTDQGPGALTGQPATTFSLTLRNGSKEPVDLNTVVVSVVYGTDSAASPVYSDDTLADFRGTVQPGDTATATYAFSIPKDQLARTTLWVDFDGKHTAATFTGTAR